MQSNIIKVHGAEVRTVHKVFGIPLVLPATVFIWLIQLSLELKINHRIFEISTLSSSVLFTMISLCQLEIVFVPLLVMINNFDFAALR